MGEGDRRVRGAAAGDLAGRLRSSGTTPWGHYAPEVIRATERLRDFDRAGADGSNQVALTGMGPTAMGSPAPTMKKSLDWPTTSQALQFFLRLPMFIK